jgi:predicted permease
MHPVRYAWRQLRRTPGFTVAAVTTLALGIAANTAFFSIVNALVLKPLPGVDLTGLSVVMKGGWPLTLEEFRAVEATPPAGAGIVAASASGWPAILSSWGEVNESRIEQTTPELVTGDFARVLRLTARAGRWIGPEDDRSPDGELVAVISDRIWREWYGARTDIVGRASVRLKVGIGPGRARSFFTIVGVAAADFRGLQGRFDRRDVWIPMTAAARLLLGEADPVKWMRQTRPTTIVRPSIGVTDGTIEAALQAQLAPRAAGGPPPPAVRMVPAASAKAGRHFLGLGVTILGLATLVLVAACANLANMLYARGVGRSAEMAVRLSLGGSRGHLIRLLFAEVGIIAAIAASAGLALAIAVTRLFTNAFPYLLAGRYSQLALDLSPDWRVFLFAFAAGGMAAVIVGGVTAWRTVRAPLLQTLAGSGAPTGMTARGQRLRTLLVAVQVVVAVVLVMFAGLGFEELRTNLDRAGAWGRRVHYDVGALSTAQLNLEHHDYTRARARAFLAQRVVELKPAGSIEGVTLGDSLPGADGGAGTMLAAEGRQGQPSNTNLVNASFARVTPGYLKTIGLRLIRGRDFDASDAEGAPLVAIVSERTADRLWPGQEALGQRMVFGVKDWLTVVGVCADPISASGDAPLRRSFFAVVPYAQYYNKEMRVIVRSRAPDGSLGVVRSVIRQLDPNVAVLDAGWAENSMLAWVRPQQAAMLLVMSLGAIALGISMLGVYGVIAYSVSMRTREFGIRLALGSTRRAVVKLVLDQAIHVTLIGLLAGVFIVSVASRVIQSRQFDFMPNEIETWVVVPVLILVAGIIAGAVPAARASRVSPIVALKDQ